MPTTNTSVVVPHVPGARRRTVTKVVLGASYPTGGEPLTATQLGLSTVDWAQAYVQIAGAGGAVNVFYDIPNAKLKAFTATAEIANATDLSAITAQVVANGV